MATIPPPDSTPDSPGTDPAPDEVSIPAPDVDVPEQIPPSGDPIDPG